MDLHTRGGWGTVKMLIGTAALQEDLCMLKEWANTNLMKFSKDKCQISEVDQLLALMQEKNVSAWLGSSCSEKPRGLLEDSKLDMSQGCPVAEKKSTETKALLMQEESQYIIAPLLLLHHI